MTRHASSLLRFVTTGSVDDGKSTLIGRLLYETKSIFEDHYAAIEKTSSKRGDPDVDLSLLLDGLAAEREQAITIDVAYRYFSTPARRFIIADCPGHEQYTRNMVTGASSATLAIVLIDARKGVVTQSRRHGFLVSLLEIPHLIVAVNKMDLVGYDESVFNAIVEEYAAFSEKLDIHDITFVPISALKGDNVTDHSPNMPWYDGNTLLHVLETVHIASDRNLIDFRFPVQYVVRPNPDFRGFAGRIVSGTLRTGEEICVLPSGKTTSVASIRLYETELEEACAGQSVVMTLREEIDVSRGDMIVRTRNLPQVATAIEAIICWMDEEPLQIGGRYILKHTTRSVSAVVTKVAYRIDVNTLHREPVGTLGLNDIGRVEIASTLPLFFDPYRTNRSTGSFILIDRLTNNTVAAGMIRGKAQTVGDVIASEKEKSAQPASPHTRREQPAIHREDREKRNGHAGAVVWLTGYSGSGKSTIARILEQRLFTQGMHTVLLDGDNLRHGLCRDLGFSDEDRDENIRRAGEAARLFFENGAIVICAFISPLARQRDRVRSLVPQGRFFEVFVRCDLDICKKRDPKKLYEKAATGEIRQFTGISSDYEEPASPELCVDTTSISAEKAADMIVQLLKANPIC
jgi:bifunctional enzyme CysN/CysC